MLKMARRTAVSCAPAAAQSKRSSETRFLLPHSLHRTRCHGPKRRPHARLRENHSKQSTAAVMEESIGIPAQYLQPGCVGALRWGGKSKLSCLESEPDG